jgi:hypothetical protein
MDTAQAGEGISEEIRLQRGLMPVVHASREVPCTAFVKDSIKPSASKLCKAEGAAACQHPVGLKAPAKLIVSLRTRTTMKSAAVAEWSGATASDPKAKSQ